MTRIGILGGSFDPPHDGHLALARQALRQFGVSRMEWIPTGQPPHREGKSTRASAWHRLAMTRLAVEGEPRMVVNPIEVKRDGPSFSIDTVKALGFDRPVFVIGGDMLASLHTWKCIDELLKLVAFAPAFRNDVDARVFDDLVVRLDPVEVRAIQARVLRVPNLPVSSTQIRDAIARGEPARGLNDRVGAYIRRHGLYQ